MLTILRAHGEKLVGNEKSRSPNSIFTFDDNSRIKIHPPVSEIGSTKHNCNTKNSLSKHDNATKNVLTVLSSLRLDKHLLIHPSIGEFTEPYRNSEENFGSRVSINNYNQKNFHMSFKEIQIKL